MTSYMIAPRAKDERGTFAIYPMQNFRLESGSLNTELELAKVRARTRSEAVAIAKRRGIGGGIEIWAIEEISDDRIKGIEE